MAAVDAPPLVEHVVCFRLLRICRTVSVDVGANIGKEVGAVPGFSDRRSEACKFMAMGEEDLAVAGEVVLF